MKRVASVIETLERTAARGAGGLAPGARESLTEALCALQCSDGGFAGLDGRSDLYFSFFSWLALRALGAPFDRERLCCYVSSRRREARGIDARCADVLLVREGRCSRVAGWLSLARALACGEAVGAYGVFLLGVLADTLLPRGVPRWAARRAWRQLAARAWECVPTPQLAAGLVLSLLAEEPCAELRAALEGRRCAGGGFASAAGAPPDLLATAVTRFALRQGQPAREGHADLAFIEACWLEDGLFGASPAAQCGDAEHTFYGLLALGACR